MDLKSPTRIAYSVREAAELAGLGKDTLYAAVASGELKTSKIGTRRLVLADDLMAWLRSKAVAA